MKAVEDRDLTFLMQVRDKAFTVRQVVVVVVYKFNSFEASAAKLWRGDSTCTCHTHRTQRRCDCATWCLLSMDQPS